MVGPVKGGNRSLYFCVGQAKQTLKERKKNCIMKAMALAGQSCKQAECVMWNALYVNKSTGKKTLYYKLPSQGNPSHEAPVTRDFGWC